MELRIEWRSKGDDANSIVFIDDDNNLVRRVVHGDNKALSTFLNDIGDLDSGWEETPVTEDMREPGAWGRLVMARANSSEVLEMDPVLFWHSISVLFRLRGTDAWVRPQAFDPG